MPTYSLQLLIDPQDLSMLYAAGQRITLGKASSYGSPNVAWLVFDPLQSNTIQWDEEYGLYASSTVPQPGAAIYKLSETGIPAQAGASYSLTAAATFNGPFSGGTPGAYRAQNDIPGSAYPMLTFGLTQSAQINGHYVDEKPTSATAVLATQTLSITPTATIYIWLQSQFGSATVINQDGSRATIARFGGSVTDLTLRYDANVGVFVPQPGPARAQGAEAHVELVRPPFY